MQRSRQLLLTSYLYASVQRRSNSFVFILYNGSRNIDFVALKSTEIYFCKVFLITRRKLYITSQSFLGPRNSFKEIRTLKEFFCGQTHFLPEIAEFRNFWVRMRDIRILYQKKAWKRTDGFGDQKKARTDTLQYGCPWPSLDQRVRRVLRAWNHHLSSGFLKGYSMWILIVNSVEKGTVVSVRVAYK